MSNFTNFIFSLGLQYKVRFFLLKLNIFQICVFFQKAKTRGLVFYLNMIHGNAARVANISSQLERVIYFVPSRKYRRLFLLTRGVALQSAPYTVCLICSSLHRSGS